MLRKPRLFTPGPTPLHPEAARAAVGSMPHHRTAEFVTAFEEVQEGLRNLFRTAGPVAVLASSGTGAMEAAVANLFGAGERVAVVAGGKFGRRWAEIATAYGLETATLEIDAGEPLSPDRLVEHVEASRPLAGVLLTVTETSTGTAYDVRGLTESLRQRWPDVAVAADAIAGIGALPVCTDDWGLDAVVGGSQKAFMMPPGLGFVACSRRGWERVRRQRSTPRYYLDLRRYADAADRAQTPFTPAISLVLALRAVLQAIDEAGGIEVLEDNAVRLAEATAAAAEALRLERLAARAPSPAVTALRSPRGGQAPEIVALLRQRFAIQVAGGQADLKPDVFRIGHLGWVDDVDLLGLLAALEIVLAELGHEVEPGAGVAAAGRRLAQAT